MAGLHAVQDDGEVAPPLAGRAFPGDIHGPGHADQGDGEIDGGEVDPGRACLLGTTEQLTQHGAGLLTPCWRDGEQRTDSTVAGAVGQEIFEEADQAVPGIGIGQRCLGNGPTPAEPVTEKLFDQLFPGEVAVQRGIADARAPGDLDQADAHAFVGERLGGRGENAVPVLPCVTAQAARGFN
jgi:hypothetical protein